MTIQEKRGTVTFANMIIRQDHGNDETRTLNFEHRPQVACATANTTVQPKACPTTQLQPNRGRIDYDNVRWPNIVCPYSPGKNRSECLRQLHKSRWPCSTRRLLLSESRMKSLPTPSECIQVPRLALSATQEISHATKAGKQHWHDVRIPWVTEVGPRLPCSIPGQKLSNAFGNEAMSWRSGREALQAAHGRGGHVHQHRIPTRRTHHWHVTPRQPTRSTLLDRESDGARRYTLHNRRLALLCCSGYKERADLLVRILPEQCDWLDLKGTVPVCCATPRTPVDATPSQY